VKLSTSFHGLAIFGLAFSPDGAQLAVGTLRHISLLDIPQGKEVRRFQCRSKCHWPTFSPDGKLIAAYSWHGLTYPYHGFVQVWDVDTGKERDINPVLAGTGCTIAFVPGSQTLATPQLDSTIPFRDVASRREVRRLTFQGGAPCAFVFTPDGKTLIGGGAEHNPVVHMWDASTGKDLQHWDLTPLLQPGVPKKNN
jgi:WD40 repeat protein